MHLPDPNNPGKTQKTYLIAWLDEYSRLITHAQCYFQEKGYALEDSLKKAIIKYGCPEQVYVDNGSIYSSKHMNSVCGHLGMQLSHTRPYKPQGRGKLERFFQTVQTSCLPEIEVMLRDRALSLEELNEYLFIWIRQHYHDQIHSSTKQRPIVAFESDSQQLRIVDLAKLEDAFLLAETRTVDKTCRFKLRGMEFSVEPELVRTKILVRFNPYDLSVVQVDYNEKRHADAVGNEVPEHVDFHRSGEVVDLPTEKTGLNYLNFLKEQDTEGLSFTKLNAKRCPCHAYS